MSWNMKKKSKCHSKKLWYAHMTGGIANFCLKAFENLIILSCDKGILYMHVFVWVWAYVCECVYICQCTQYQCQLHPFSILFVFTSDAEEGADSKWGVKKLNLCPEIERSGKWYGAGDIKWAGKHKMCVLNDRLWC